MTPRRPAVRASALVLVSSLVGGVLAGTAFAAPAVAAPTTLPAAALAGPAANWPLIVTEIAPDNVGVDDFEFFELHNTTAAPIDLADGYSLAYTYVDSDDRTRDVPLSITSAAAGPVVIDAGETLVLWMDYTSGSVDTSARTVEEFRGAWGAAADVRVERVTGQPGLANGGGRGIRVLSGEDVVSWSFYPVGSVAVGQSAHFRIPGDIADPGLDVLEGPAAPTPGTIDPAALTAPEPEPEPPFDPQPDPALQTSMLQVTEILPDSANVGGADGYEFIEIYNAASTPVDFSDYTLTYLYPVDTTSNSNEVRWPSLPSDPVIEPGGRLVFWIKNSGNGDLVAADFNRHFGTDLTAGVDLVEIESAGMANGSPRGIEIETNTGFSVNRAYYNMTAGVDDVHPDQGIHYAVQPDQTDLQRMLGVTPATPGAVTAEQVPAGLMVLPVDTTPPVIDDQTAAEFDPSADLVIDLGLTDDVQVRTATLEIANDVDADTRVINLTAASDGRYRFPVNRADLTGKSWYEYTVTATDGANAVSSEARRVTSTAGDTDAVRLNVADGDYVAGTAPIAGAGESFPPRLELLIDDEAVETVPSLESEPVFAFEAGQVNDFFRNGVRIGDDVLNIFDKGIYQGTETIVTPIPLDYVVEGQELVVSVWAGTKAAPEIDLDENNDDFQINALRLVLPDGRTLTPQGYDDPTRILDMGDSAGKLDFYDARFTLPDDAFTALMHPWDTTAVADGTHVVSAIEAGAAGADDERADAAVEVDNTAPSITSTVVDGTPVKGEVVIDAQITDAGSGVASSVARLDGTTVDLPYTTSSVDLAAGDHVVEITATDAVGNVGTYSATFTTSEEQPTGGPLAPQDGAEVRADEVRLSAEVSDPTDDRLNVSFREGTRLELGDEITGYSGTTADAAETARESREAWADPAASTAAAAADAAPLGEVASDRALPYQLFELEIPADAGADATARVTWSGSADAGAQVVLSVMNTATGAWEEIDRRLTTEAETAVEFASLVPVADHVAGGVMTVLVQHSVGWAGADLSTRETPVTPHNAADVPRSDYDFTIAWESDTQYYNEEFYEHQLAIHDYLLERREALNLQYLVHTGDIVDDWDQPYQWENADPAYRALDEAGLPYGVLAGNHDVGGALEDYSVYSQFFGEARFADNPWYGGSYQDNRGHYDLVSAGGIDFLMLYMGWGPTDESIAWMNEVLAAHPERIAIVNLHEFMLTTGGLGPVPQQIQDEVVATNPNVKMVFSGHYHDAFTRTDTFDDDGDGVAERTVYSMLFDYQGLPEGGLGFLRLLHFDNEGERMMVRTYSPSLDVYNSDDPTLELEHQEFEVPYAALGIAPSGKTLVTDAVGAEVLTTSEIAAVTDVASGSIVTVDWTAPELGEQGWYVTTTDPYGAVDHSAVSMLTVLPALAPEPGPGPETPGGGSGGGGDSGAGDGAGGPGTAPAGSTGADGLATTGTSLALPGAIALALLAAGALLIVIRRRRAAERS
ncbi:MAG: lamin tail domain-containing protein [Microbacteriaceae bacterium]